MPRRNDIQKILVIGCALIVLAADSYSLVAQVDCVSPGRVFAIRNRGLVVDPFGTALADVKLAIESNGKMVEETVSDKSGNFSFKHNRGVYTLTARFAAPLDHLSVELHSGASTRTLLHPGQLRVVLGIPYMFCTWVTTDRKEFEYEIGANNSHLKESEEKNATQK